MGKSIGRKVNFVLVLLGIVFVLSVWANTAALDIINDNNRQILNVYMQTEIFKGRLNTQLQQVLFNYKQVDDEEATYDTLTESITAVYTWMSKLSETVAISDRDEVISACEALQKQVIAFTESMTSLSIAKQNGDISSVQYYSAQVEKVIPELYAAIDTFDKASLAAVADKGMHSDTKIQGTLKFNNILLVLYACVFVIVIFVVVKTVSKPAKRSQQSLQEITSGIERNDGNLTARIPVTSKDEIGKLSEGINCFIEQLQRTIKCLQEDALALSDSVNITMKEIDESNESAGNVSATMEQMSASLEEISAMLGQIVEGNGTVTSDIEHINRRMDDGVELVRQIKGRADSMRKSTLENKNNAATTVSEIRDKLQAALEGCRSVEKINELTGDILSITGQTNLLSLNASIEAARAGEAGRGFSVVANEIRQLADNSATTANNIQDISSQVTSAVERLAKNAEEMLQFINECVMRDYDGFVDVVEQYAHDADSVNEILDEFALSTSQISETIEQINDGLNGISTAVDESAKGVTNVAESAVHLVDAITQIHEAAEKNQNISNKLELEVGRFSNV